MTPDPAPILDLIEAFRRSKAMFAAVALGVFDLLEGGARDVEAIAAATGTRADALDRLLDGCVSLGLLRRRGAAYANTEVASTYLVRSSPRTMAGYILYSNQALFPMWSHLEDALREGSPRWEQSFGPAADLFSHFFRTDEALADFLLGMHGFGQITSRAVVAAFDLSRFRRLVDLGGATGHLALAAQERYPAMEAVLFDLPQVVEFSMRFGGSRLERRAGDFFGDPLPEADLYAIGRILHDWREEKIRRLLERIAAALPVGGGLLIAEALVDEDHAGPVPALMQSLNMLVCTEGRERTLSEYRRLLEPCGFGQVEGRRTGLPLDAILAIRQPR